MKKIRRERVSELCAEQIDYKNLDFLYQETRRLLPEKSLTRTEIADIITKENPRKHVVVYELLGKILNRNEFVNRGGNIR